MPQAMGRFDRSIDASYASAARGLANSTGIPARTRGERPHPFKNCARLSRTFSLQQCNHVSLALLARDIECTLADVVAQMDIRAVIKQ